LPYVALDRTDVRAGESLPFHIVGGFRCSDRSADEPGPIPAGASELHFSIATLVEQSGAEPGPTTRSEPQIVLRSWISVPYDADQGEFREKVLSGTVPDIPPGRYLLILDEYSHMRSDYFTVVSTP
jgi:hypothetical protein